MSATAPSDNIRLTGLPLRMVQEGVLNDEQARSAISAAREAKVSLIPYLVDNKLVAGNEVARLASIEFGIPLFDLKTMDMDVCAAKLIDSKLIEKNQAIPLFKRGSRLFVAVSDPTNLNALDEIKFTTGTATQPILVEHRRLIETIDAIINASDTSMADLDDSSLEDLDITSGDEENKDGDDDAPNSDDTPIVRFINKIMLDAINKGASDLHFEPYEKKYRVRFRVDGVLKEVASPPVQLTKKIAARLKVMSKLDISERRVPQDGRIRLMLSKNRAIDFRVNTCPTLFGEKIVCRILDPTSAQLGIDALGYEPEQKKLFMDAIHRPYGMVLVTGPTGSGKTVSLYTALNILNTEDRNISTAEDPAEINLPGINQVNVNPKAGLTFSSALKAFLRQDPDIIMVGEIRDIETGEIAIKAAQTGHMVLSTLHTNNAPQTLNRLVNMGIAPFNIASAVSLVIAQRLGRRLCSHCKKPVDIPKKALLEEGFTEQDLEKGFTVYGPVGCDQCNDGYKGRVGIYQVMPISEVIAKIIMDGGNALQIADQAKAEGIPDLRESGLKKVKQGILGLEELNRVVTE
ncbi:MAG: type IV-A pilus assembly ATPase PilB [Gammaproteobacteria bacterium]|nr:type IV-A pilus assembly ATPase PilB [Gammaproteobacteria bacterium]